MGSLTQTYQHIAHILSYENSNSDLERLLSPSTFNWDAIVVEGSRHLMLPAIYCRLKARGLEHCLPGDLYAYLEHLTEINRNRNAKIIKQIYKLSELLNANNISHVFLKGSALLVMDVYKDTAERMVGDIDILIEKRQLELAFDIIKNSGYTETTGYAYKTLNFRHLDRLIKPDELAAVELHDQLFNTTFSHLIQAKAVLSRKQLVKDVAIPDYMTLLNHLILASQVNDDHYYYKSLSFKTIYDCLQLSNWLNPSDLESTLNSKFHNCFFSIASLYFNEFQPIQKHVNKTYYQKIHHISFKYTLLGTLIRGIKHVILNVTERFNLLIFNPFYRKHLVKKIFSFKLA